MNNARKSPIRRALAVGGAALLLVGAAVGTGAYNLLKPTAAASTPIAAVPLATNSVDLPVTTDASDGASATPAIYEIQPADSQASFTIDEVLRGSPKTVVGTTDQVSGQIAFDSSDPSSAQVGTILIDARTLATDDSSRNRVLNNQILSTDQYEYISFTTAQISGLPQTVTPGQPFTFQLSGDLTIRGVSKPATFDVTVTPAADGTLSGSATTTIQYSDWGISIPSVPFVASVGNQVVLQLNFAATAAA